MANDLHPSRMKSMRMRGGTSQNTRLLAALDPAAAPLADRTEAELLVWAARFSQTVRFFNRENRIEGNWSPFFESEPIVQYAMIDAQNMDIRAAALHEQIQSWQHSAVAEGNLLSLLYEQCQRIHRWHGFFSCRTDEHVFAAAIASAIDLTFSAALQTARLWEIGRLESGGTCKLDNDLSSFDAVLWKISAASTPTHDSAVVKADMAGILMAAHAAEERLVDAARVRLKVLLTSPSQLAPHFALFLAFLRQLKEHAHSRLNHLTHEHLNLFYREILEERPAARVPDSVCVAFGTAPGAQRFQLPAGTLLTAKAPAGRQALYALTEAMDLSDCRIDQLCTMGALPADASTVNPQAGEAWPMEGALQRSCLSAAASGFAIASSCLHLESGHRTVTLKIRFQCDVDPPGLTLGNAGPLEVAGIDCAYSAATGWVVPFAKAQNGNLSVTLDPSTSHQFLAFLVVRLRPEDPPWVSPAPGSSQAAIHPSLPLLKISQCQVSLAPAGSVHGALLWLLGNARVTDMTLEVQVSQARPNSLANSMGPIAPGTTMLPFGCIPVAGAAFVVTCPEIAAKKLESLTLDLDWQNLPLDPALYPGGLASYYSAYAELLQRMNPELKAPFCRAAYRVAVDFLKCGEACPPGTAANELFIRSTQNESVTDGAPQASPDEVIAQVTRLSFSGALQSAERPQPTADGCLRVVLTAPSYAFGHSLYPQVVTDIALRNAETMMLRAQPQSDSATTPPTLLPQANPPLTPALSAVTLNYQASATVSFAAEHQSDCCYQILPFFTQRMLLQNGTVSPLLSPVETGVTLYVGLAQVAAAQMISLLFVLQDKAADALKESEADAQEWSVLCRDGWQPRTAASHTLKDQTHGLQTSGLVQVAIPAEVDDQSRLMPQGLCWLRVHARRPGYFPSVLQILPQAGIAVRMADSATAPCADSLPAGSLQALQTPDPRVKSILQPLPSFGGRAAETEPQFLTRVSERLRHKGRAWTAWDYEHLVLQQFPEIFHARCLPHTRHPGSGDSPEHAMQAAGHVLIVVLPRWSQPPAACPPRLPAAMLSQVEAWLRQRASPAVTLRVCNPRYETLQLTLEVSFDGSQPPGTAQERLNQELREFISPWIYQPVTVLLPTFEFQLAGLSDFIQSRPYVRSLNACAFSPATQGVQADGWIRPSTAWSMLITAEQHNIITSAAP